MAKLHWFEIMAWNVTFRTKTANVVLPHRRKDKKQANVGGFFVVVVVRKNLLLFSFESILLPEVKAGAVKMISAKISLLSVLPFKMHEWQLDGQERHQIWILWFPLRGCRSGATAARLHVTQLPRQVPHVDRVVFTAQRLNSSTQVLHEWWVLWVRPFPICLS